jgi:hypothetical protein
MDKIFIGARYVPKLEGQWDINKEYENFSIVQDVQGNSYTSKKNVPSGIELTNTDYWILSSNFNAQLASISSRLELVENATGSTLPQTIGSTPPTNPITNQVWISI